VSIEYARARPVSTTTLRNGKMKPLAGEMHRQTSQVDAFALGTHVYRLQRQVLSAFDAQDTFRYKR
jgi:hypothetical protein